MPTYKNISKQTVPFFLRLNQNDGEFRRVTITFAPGEEKMLPFALPNHAERGLEITDHDFPPLPDPIIFNNTLEYREGFSREFDIRPCDRYLVQVIAQSGRVSFRFGASGTPIILDAGLPYKTKFGKKVDWESAPLLIIEGLSENATCTLHVEELSAGELEGVI